VITSVHAFATDPARGIFILAFLAMVIGASLALFAWRAPKVGLGGVFALLSRESLLLTNNVLLLTAAGAVMLGTLYPLFLEALGMSKISVGPPYFDAVFAPLMAPALFLMGVGPIARWKEATLPDLTARLKWAFAVAVLSAILLPITMGRWTPWIALGLLLGVWIIAAGFANLRERLAQLAGTRASLADRLRSLPRNYWGMLVAHFGVGVFVIGVTMVRGYETEKDVRMSVGDTVEVGGHSFRLARLAPIRGPNYEAMRGDIEVTRAGRSVALLHPEKRHYLVQQMPMTEADIDSGLTRDLYVSLGEPVGDGAWVVRVYHKPFIDWIWGGGFLMAIGGVVAVSDRRYRLGRRESRDPSTGQYPTPLAHEAPRAS
jgi:cytochrome c-type biogenesis protein CcmF